MRRIRVRGRRLVISTNKTIRKPASIGGKIKHIEIEDGNYTNLDRLKDSLKNLSLSTTKKTGKKKRFVNF